MIWSIFGALDNGDTGMASRNTKRLREPKYSICWDSKRSGEVQRGQYPRFSSAKEAAKECARLNAGNRFPTSGRFVVIDL